MVWSRRACASVWPNDDGEAVWSIEMTVDSMPPRRVTAAKGLLAFPGRAVTMITRSWGPRPRW